MARQGRDTNSNANCDHSLNEHPNGWDNPDSELDLNQWHHSHYDDDTIYR